MIVIKNMTCGDISLVVIRRWLHNTTLGVFQPDVDSLRLKLNKK